MVKHKALTALQKLSNRFSIIIWSSNDLIAGKCIFILLCILLFVIA